MPRAREYQINLRTNEERWMYLHSKENYTQYINDLIDKDRFERGDPEYLKRLKQQKQQEIKDIDKLLKGPPVNQDKIQECLKYWHDVYENKNFVDKRELERSLEKRVMPNLKKLGYRGTSQDIATLFLNWPEED